MHGQQNIKIFDSVGKDGAGAVTADKLQSFYRAVTRTLREIELSKHSAL